MTNIFNGDVMDSDANLILIPIDTEGFLSPQFAEALVNEHFEAPLGNYSLGDVLIKTNFSKTSGPKYLAFCCTFNVDEQYSTYSAIQTIGRAVGEWANNNSSVRNIASPLLGTGAGRLRREISHAILAQAFLETAPSHVTLDIYIKDYKIFSEQLHNFIAEDNFQSSRIILEAGLELAQEDAVILEVKKSSDFYYELARMKFVEFKEYKNVEADFFTRVRNNFKKSKTTFTHYLQQIDRAGDEFEFLELCGQMVAYIDFNAYLKNLWNRNSDKRVLAKSGVNQTHWIDNLIKFKEHGNSVVSLPQSIKNSFLYLSDPWIEIPMLSDNHRKKVFRNLLGKTYQHPSDLNLLYKFFRELNITPSDPINESVLVTRILYHKSIRLLWLDEGPKMLSYDITIESAPDPEIDEAFNLIFECFVSKSPTLELGNCGITDLMQISELFECEHLEELILSNEWAINVGDSWKREGSRNSGGLNKINMIPPQISRLKNLRLLIIGGDWSNGEEGKNRWGITNLDPVLKLINLEFLNVSNNQLTGIKSLDKLSNLKFLHLNNNYIDALKSLKGLANLKELYISNNSITNLGFLKGVHSLTTLDLHSNEISSLSVIQPLISKLNVTNTKWDLNTINVASNPLSEPSIKTIILGKDAVLRYFKEIREQASFINRDIKIILIGNSEAGKTTLSKYLDHKTDLHVKHSATHWLDEKTILWDCFDSDTENQYTIRLFDFGGHDFYHDTHHIFFTHNSLYILVWDKETDDLSRRELNQRMDEIEQSKLSVTQDYPIKYWLDSIAYFTKDVQTTNLDIETKNQASYTSLALLLQNKVENVKMIKPIDNEMYYRDYPFIYEALNVDLLAERNTQHMMNIINEMLNDAKIIGEKLPRYYLTIKEALVEYAGEPVLSISRFNAYCNSLLDFSIDLEQTRDLAAHLKYLGVIGWFPKDFIDDKVYVDKNWLIRNIRKALIGLEVKNGRFTYEELRGKVDSMDDWQLLMLVDVMIDYNMIFKHPYKNDYIAPLYLPEKPAPTISIFLSNTKITHRRFQYIGYIQKNVILQLFQKYGQLIPPDQHDQTTGTYYYWKNGLIIKGRTDGEIVLINFDMGKVYGEAHIDIYHLGGPDSDFITEVTNYIREINKGYDVDEQVTLDGINHISIKLLEEYALAGRYEFTERTMQDIGKTRLDDKIFKLKDYSKFVKNMKKLKVAISYSKNDISQVNAFLRYLNPLVNDNLIDLPWYCSDLEAGCEWNDEIETNFKEADIIFFMMSDHFFDTEYILQHEIPNSITRYRTDKSVKIVPILLVHYPWGSKGEFNLQDFTALPYQAKPISDYKDKNMAWYMVSKKIRIMIEKSLDPGIKGGIDRELKVLFERQVNGKLDNNS